MAEVRAKTGRPVALECGVCEHNKSYAGIARAVFLAPPPTVRVCADRMQDADDVAAVLAHELTHAYDHAVLEKDLRRCRDLAFSEVRAARESECFPCRLCPRGWTFFNDRCVRRHAVRSTQSMFPGGVGEACVDAVFAEAMADVRPVAGGSAGGAEAGGGASQAAAGAGAPQ